MRAGKLNARITIQRRVGQDAAGQPADNWQDVATVWAWHMPLNGRSSLRGGLMSAIVGNSWRIRYMKIILDADMRVLYEGRAFDVTRIDVDYAGKTYIDLICESDGSNYGG